MVAFGRAPARFDDEELAQLNQKIVHQLAYDAVKDRLPEGMGVDGWEVIRPNLHDMGEVDQWWKVVTGPVDKPDLSNEDAEFVCNRHFLFWKRWNGLMVSGKNGPERSKR